MTRKYRKFDEDFKQGAVQLVIETGRPIAQVARDLGVNEGTLGTWCAQERKARGRRNHQIDPRARFVDQHCIGPKNGRFADRSPVCDRPFRLVHVVSGLRKNPAIFGKDSILGRRVSQRLPILCTRQKGTNHLPREWIVRLDFCDGRRIATQAEDRGKVAGAVTIGQHAGPLLR